VSGLPARVDLAVVGGGVVGASIAWHARREGLSVLLLERRTISSGATSQAAALLTRARSKPGLMPLVTRTYAAIEELERALDEPLNLHRNGSLHGAEGAESVTALRALTARAIAEGIPAEWIGPERARRLVPWLAADRLRACAFMPEDGFLDPYLLGTAYARAAAAEGAMVRTGIEVTGLLREGARVTGVATSHGAVEAATVALAAGAWSIALAWRHGIALATAPVRSQYWITERSGLFPREQPVVVLPEARCYARPELGALLFGLREAVSVSVDGRTLPADAGSLLLGERGGWESLADGADALHRYFPAFAQTGIAHHVAGLSTYTPDGLPLLGQVLGAPGLLVASGWRWRAWRRGGRAPSTSAPSPRGASGRSIRSNRRTGTAAPEPGRGRRRGRGGEFRSLCARPSDRAIVRTAGVGFGPPRTWGIACAIELGCWSWLVSCSCRRPRWPASWALPVRREAS
jgi:4-methylaminobutanoate oxidase (formaldehyde-forming)